MKYEQISPSKRMKYIQVVIVAERDMDVWADTADHADIKAIVEGPPMMTSFGALDRKNPFLETIEKEHGDILQYVEGIMPEPFDVKDERLSVYFRIATERASIHLETPVWQCSCGWVGQNPMIHYDSNAVHDVWCPKCSSRDLSYVGTNLTLGEWWDEWEMEHMI